MGLIQRIRRVPTIKSGRFTYRGKDEYSRMALQLRVEKDGLGLLVINANTVLYLNETAMAHAYFFMQGMPTETAVKNVTRLYKVDKETARKEHEKLVYAISTLAKTEKVCPVSFLDVKSVEPFTQQYSAPLRMDLALTFKCQNDCIHCYAGGSHETAELSTEQWKKVIDKLQDIGIFIITFTGGEPTLREDLPELLKYAQDKGIVTGLITNGRRLSDMAYVKNLEKAGLDFVQVTLESRRPAVHDKMTGAEGSWTETVQGIKNAQSTQIYVSTNTTLSKYNASDFPDTIEFIKELGVPAFGANSLIYAGKANKGLQKFALPLDKLKEILMETSEKASRLGLKFLWYTPTQYCRLNPVNLGLGIKSCTAALVNMCVGPSGDVYPCQSYFESLGNILEDSWQAIWNKPLAVSLRKREYAEPKCKDCPELLVCGGGCPLELKQNEYFCNTFA